MRDPIIGLGWFVRRTHDVERLAAFFRDTVGLPVLREQGEAVQFWAGEATVFEIAPGGQPNPAYTDRAQAPCVPIFRVHGIRGTIQRLREAGVRFINEFEREHNHLAYFLDPLGNVTGLQERYRTSDRPEDREAWRRWDAGETRIDGVAPLPPDIQHIGWIVFRSLDVPAQIAFYRDVVGLEVAVSYSETNALMRLGDGVLLELSPGSSPQPRPADRGDVTNTPVLRVRDLDTLVADLQAKGVDFVNLPFDIPFGRIAYFVDPENHLVGLQERRPESDRVEDREARRRWGA
ncbi:MAG: VOC family protein [Chloroflexota bacterium]|nr:VOC family protein [Dehalococcoidia bacterium]MDW8254534.1 VOC family protein [Chloroflexota bacterium]